MLFCEELGKGVGLPAAPDLLLVLGTGIFGMLINVERSFVSVIITFF